MLLGACSQDTSAATEEATEGATDEAAVVDETMGVDETAEAADPAAEDDLGAVAAGLAFYEDNACASCHVEGVDDVMAPPSLIKVDAGSLLAFMDGTAPHTGGATEGVTEADAANLEAYLATL